MIWGGGAPMRENNVKFKTGNNQREDKESSLPSGYSLKLRWEEVDRRSSKKRDLYQDLAMLRPRRFVDTKMKQESNKSFAYKCVMTLAPPKFLVKDYSASLILLRKRLRSTNCQPIAIAIDNFKRRENFPIHYEQVIDQFADSSAIFQKRVETMRA